MATKQRKSTSKADETKADKFRRLAVARVTRAVKAIDGIGKLAGGGYERTPQQVEKITAALSQAVLRVKSRFEGSKDAPTIEL